jgi:gliding motility-associated-like protein
MRKQLHELCVMTKKLLLYPLFFIILSTNYVFSQVDREFWFAIPKETSQHIDITPTNNVSFKITAMDLDATVTINMPANSSYTQQTITVPAGTTYVFVLATNYPDYAKVYANSAAYTAAPTTGYSTKGGFHITSDNDITVYYDYDNSYNRELYSLKGANSLGSSFYCPFQTIWANDYATAYSTVEIVSTEDDNEITITPQAGQTIYNPSAPTTPITSPFTVTLGYGEVYSVRAMYRTAAGHLSGLKITSDYDIAVTTNDDSQTQVQPYSSYSSYYGCQDTNGDQLVPTTIIGSKYLVMPGNQSNTYGYTLTSPYEYPNGVGEQIFVVATKANTNISFYDTTGTILKTLTLNAGGSGYFSVDITQSKMSSIYISSNDASKPFYVYHITGIGCELGGAIIPPITNCTGSNEVSFYRSSTVDDITVNLMVPYDKTYAFTDSVHQSHYKFSMVRFKSTGNDTIHIPGYWFEPNREAGWAVLKMSKRQFNNITIQGIAHKVINTSDFFHLGMANGKNSKTGKYGYFSSFNAVSPSVYIPANQEDNYIACYGEDVTLVAKGGLTYTWHYGSPSGPPTYLDNANSANPTASGLPVGNHNFYVEITQSKCFGTDTLKLNVTILPVVTASFSIDKYNVCSPDTVHITNTSANGDKYTWKKQVDGGAAQTLSFTSPNTALKFSQYLNNPSSTTPQTIVYSLITESNQGCSDQVSDTVTVFPRIQADFTLSDTLGCNPLTVNFTNTSGGNTGTYEWTFGDKGSSVETDPNHIYTNYTDDDTTYNVTLVAKSPYYCTDTATAKVTVHPYIYAYYATDTVSGCSPLNITIQDGSLGAISRYKWEYGNKDTSNRTDSIYTYSYTNTGLTDSVCRLRLSVFNKAGCIDSMSRVITTYPEIQTDFSPSVDNGCSPLSVTFTNKSNAAADKFYWDFGDGTSSYDKNPTHEYNHLSTKDTTYMVVLRASTSERCPGYDTAYILLRGYIEPKFSFDTSKFCAPDTITFYNKTIAASGSTYSWTFGDGTTSNDSASVIKHYYRNQTVNPFYYNVSLSITGTGGCNKVLTQPITVYPEIYADFEPDTSVCNPTNLQFINLSRDTVAVNFKWTFSDGATSEEKNPLHTFSNLSSTNKVYPVTLISSSYFNCRDTVTKNITVYPYINAVFAIDKGNGCSPLTVAITDSSSGGITSKFWSTGVTTIMGNLTSYTYTNNTDTVQTRNLMLAVSNGHCISSYTVPVTIYPAVNAVYTVNGESDSIIGCTPFPVDFEHTWGYRNIIDRYYWSFGDDASSEDKTVTAHTYTNIYSTIQKHTSQLIVFSEYNCSDTSSIDIYLYPFIEAKFAVDDAEGCSPHTVTISNASSDGANTFKWVFGDNSSVYTTSSTSDFTHVYNNLKSFTQDYKLSLVASYNGLCPQDTYQYIKVYPVVKASFTEDTLKGCHPLTVNYTNTSTNASSSKYKWSFGDKGTSLLESPVHTYSNYSTVDSVYTVKLTATSDFNCTDDTSKTVIVYPTPQPFIYVDNAIACPPFDVIINNQSLAGDTFYWNFGDGTHYDTTYKTGLHDTVTYYNSSTSNIKSYEIDLLIKTIHNCSATASQTIEVYPMVRASFAPDDTSGCNSFSVPFRNLTAGAETYKWDYNDGTTGRIKNPTHRFFNTTVYDSTFYVSMIGVSKYECSDTAYGTVTVFPQPDVSFTALPTHMTYPSDYVDIVNETNDGFWTWNWNFGDNITSSDRDPLSHTYATWGQYTISLVATSNHNCTDTATQLITIYSPKPIAGFIASENKCEGEATFTFQDTSWWAKQWYWEFDDGGISTEQNPSHTYTDPGTYQVKLTVTCEDKTDYSYRTVIVYPKPVIRGDYLFTYDPSLVMLPDVSDGTNSSKGLVNFENHSMYGTKFLWYFGDGDQSSAENPQHRYTSIGVYDVTQNVWTQYGCFDSVTIREAVNVIIHGKVVFPNAFTPNPDGANGGAYNLTDIDNDVFHPYWEGVIDFKMEIYDRWGEKLYETSDINIGWDGYYKGKLCKADVYVYKAKGHYADGSVFNSVGDVTLIR